MSLESLIEVLRVPGLLTTDLPIPFAGSSETVYKLRLFDSTISGVFFVVSEKDIDSVKPCG